MQVKQIIGGLEYTATVGSHIGTANPANFITVEGPGLIQPAQYLRNLDKRERRGTEAEGRDAIRYTVDNLVLPLAVADALRLRKAA